LQAFSVLVYFSFSQLVNEDVVVARKRHRRGSTCS